jgi:asparagine synthase (glutamine-hydrolysing)
MVNDLLHNEDTMSMAHSVESRVPFLDLEVVRFAATIPDRLRFGYGLKGLLKKSLRGILPSQTLNKKKWGFTVDPVEQYKKDLRTLALDVLTPDRLRQGGIFNHKFVKDVLAAPPRDRLRWHYFMLWQMIGIEYWREQFLK